MPLAAAIGSFEAKFETDGIDKWTVVCGVTRLLLTFPLSLGREDTTRRDRQDFDVAS